MLDMIGKHVLKTPSISTRVAGETNVKRTNVNITERLNMTSQEIHTYAPLECNTDYRMTGFYPLITLNA